MRLKAKYLGARSPQVECFFVERDGEVAGFVQYEYHAADNEGPGGGIDLVLLPAYRGRASAHKACAPWCASSG
jgi:hypothetical protein